MDLSKVLDLATSGDSGSNSELGLLLILKEVLPALARAKEIAIESGVPVDESGVPKNVMVMQLYEFLTSTDEDIVFARLSAMRSLKKYVSNIRSG